MSTTDRKTALCSGDCGNVYFKEDMTMSCFGDWYCNEDMFIFICEQEYMVGNDDPLDYNQEV